MTRSEPPTAADNASIDRVKLFTTTFKADRDDMLCSVSLGDLRVLLRLALSSTTKAIRL